MKKRILTGITTTGTPHIGNYLGAIKPALKLAAENDIILVAGKGHEKYQEVQGDKIPFDDMKELKQSLNIIC